MARRIKASPAHRDLGQYAWSSLRLSEINLTWPWLDVTHPVVPGEPIAITWGIGAFPWVDLGTVLANIYLDGSLIYKSPKPVPFTSSTGILDSGSQPVIIKPTDVLLASNPPLAKALYKI